MIRLGITGGIGSGKSTVSELLNILDIPVYIADIESKKLTESSTIIRSKLINCFGEDLYESNVLNKKKLASIIFSDKKKLQQANEIIHPEVDKHYTNWCLEHINEPIIGVESAILFESNMVRLTDKSLLVYSPVEDRIQRTMKRDNTARENVLARMNNQTSDELKLEMVDYIIYNNEESPIIDQTQDVLTKLYNTKHG